MKKLAVLLMVFVLGFVVSSCQNSTNTEIEATLSIVEDTLSTTSVSIDIEIVDTLDEITGTINVRLNDNTGKAVTSQNKSFATANDATLLVYTALVPDTTYTVVVNATVGRDSIQIATFSFKTRSLSTLEIKTVEDFLAMGQNRGGSFVLQNDIDFDGVDFVTPFTSAFTGSFDGQGFTLSNISIDQSRLYNGVFGYVSNGSIKNVTLDNVQIGTENDPITTSSSTKTGILAGYQTSTLSTFEDITIQNSAVYLSSSASTYVTVGGVVGEVRGNVFNVTVRNTSVNLTSTSNGTVRLGGAYGYIFESGKTYQHDVEVNTHYNLDAISTTRVNRSYTINIGGFAGDVDPSSVSNGLIHSIKHDGSIEVTSLNFNPLQNDKATYTVLVGGLFGNLNRGISNVITYNRILVNFLDDDKDEELSKTLRVNGISPVYNSFYVADHIVLVGDSLTVNVPLDVRTQLFDGLTKYTVDALSTYSILLNDETVTDSNVNLIDSLEGYFDSEYLNSMLED